MPPCRSKGFTLVELLVTIVILGLLAFFGVPSTQAMIAGNRATTQSNELVSTLLLARSEAIRRNQPVSVCPSTDGVSCTGNGNWNVGWITFVDSRQAGEPLPVAGNASILRQNGPITGGNAMQGPPFIRYFRSGMLSLDRGANEVANDLLFQFTLTTNDCAAGFDKNIRLTLGGRPRTTQRDC